VKHGVKACKTQTHSFCINRSTHNACSSSSFPLQSNLRVCFGDFYLRNMLSTLQIICCYSSKLLITSVTSKTSITCILARQISCFYSDIEELTFYTIICGILECSFDNIRQLCGLAVMFSMQGNDNLKRKFSTIKDN
jgi:hypothetical protein